MSKTATSSTSTSPERAEASHPFNANVLAYTEEPEVIEGEVPNNRFVLIEFADVETAKAWYNSDDYAAVRGLRIEGAPGTLVILPGM